MLPVTARPNDIVEVINEDHDYYGLVGKLTSKDEENDKYSVDIFGKSVTFRRKDLVMKARVGTSKHLRYEEIVHSKQTTHLTKEDYNVLINLAIDQRDFEWAKELLERRDGK
ncbi:hypothetical protein [Pseudobacillus badius]|uniref:hypothetical protein n=1 Tax=Bacillus badius TaxID=1455 RepID=UPI0007B39FF8|nr:hypothetical protein [Bacillus badius]KZR57921.1 hypothetical protein A3781_19280 [Bacillus badius]